MMNILPEKNLCNPSEMAYFSASGAGKGNPQIIKGLCTNHPPPFQFHSFRKACMYVHIDENSTQTLITSREGLFINCQKPSEPIHNLRQCPFVPPLKRQAMHQDPKMMVVEIIFRWIKGDSPPFEN
jgi:hypothetical protein